MAVYNIDIVNSEDLKTGDIINCDYSGSVKNITLRAGTYQLECWGAQGGDYSTTYLGGKGGYSVGTLTISEENTFYLYAGGAGIKISTASTQTGGGFNGGGHAYATSTSYYSCSGGGGTDVRIGQDSLYSRVLVAGGGGGAFGALSPYSNGGTGGGTTGGTGTGSTSYYPGEGGTQTSPGVSYYGTTADSTSYGDSADFGSGGSPKAGYSSGGGGGWYGGGYARRTSGGGGSGYIYTSSTASDYPEGCLLNSSMYLTNANIYGGDVEFDAPDGTSETGHSGDGYIRITILDIEPLDYDIYDIDDIAGSEVQLNFEYTGTVQTRTLQPGTYKLECWGAQGGNVESAPGGLGGYSVGILTLSTSTTIYIYVGGQGVEAYDGLVSGGFNGGGNGQNCPSGGGASDIRIGQDSLYARVIVAGGGGSAAYNQGGWGGGIRASYFDDNDPIYTGGTQTGPGLPSPYSITATQPNFGIGGGANSTSLANYPDVAIVGGGGGWYGGSYLSDEDELTPSTGGGSGYVYTEDTASNYPNGCLLSSSYYLHNAETVHGLDQDPDNYYRDDQKIPSPDNTGDYDYQGYELGHEGNGYVRITYVTSPNMPSFNPGDKIKCNYNGYSRQLQLPAGCYDIKCYGAQGGDAKALGGKGGYATGIIKLDGTEILYVYVGGQGTSTVDTSTNAAGGFNGGGDARTSSSSYHCGSGGGASDIRINADSLYARVIVAGGGGGSGGYTTSMNGGAGGGIEGKWGKQYSTSYYHGKGGTQTAAGISYYSTTADSTSYYDLATFGVGGSAKATSYYYRAGGGGGWYGGGGSCYSGAGGGSSYVFTPDLATNYPTGCLLTEDYYLANGHLESDKKSGDGYIELKYLGNINLINIDDLAWHEEIGNITNFEYTGDVQTTVLTAGKYKLECWGAQGARSATNTKNTGLGVGGAGGYSTGIVTLSSTTNVYIYVGGQGYPSGCDDVDGSAVAGVAKGGFNGGGYSYGSDSSDPAGGGGGASDIRIGQDSLYARIIVAGGGSGGGEDSEAGGAGGGIAGVSTSGTAGTQTSPSGCFGQAYHTSYDGGGAGGGWYGGSPSGATAAIPTSNSGSDTSGGPGGSGYVYTESTALNYPSGCLLNNSYYLSDAETIAGNQSFTAPDGTVETGHTGHGYVRITKIEQIPPLQLSYKKGDIIYGYCNNIKREISLPKGIFQLDIYGAQGGNGLYDYGGFGGYSRGILNITDDLSLYIYTGGQGILTTITSTLINGGFNGGGDAYTTYSECMGGSGGGASDIRIGQDSLYTRVIVAGGGGGAAAYSNTSYSYNLDGGIGGGISGTDGGQYSTSYKAGTGGTQTTAGISYRQTTADPTSYCTPASFGTGGSAKANGGYQAGGGGGWYGGGCSSLYGAGGGGSGYVYTSSTASNYPEGCLLNSTYYLTDASTENAVREGNGYIQITVLDVSSINAKVKIGGVWKDINSIYMKVGGEWKAANGLKVKTNGSWRDSS